MKIFYITNARIPSEKAHSFQIIKMCETYSALGNEVSLILPSRCKWNGNIFDHYSVKANFNVRYIDSFDVIKRQKWFGPLAHTLQSVFFAFTSIKSVRPEKEIIIMTRTPEISFLYSIFGYRTVCELHNLPSTRMGNFLLKFYLRKSSLVICNSEGTEKVCNQIGIKRTLIAHNGVDVDSFNIEVSKINARKSLGIPLDRIVIMYVGALEKWKGVETLYKASDYLSEKYIVVIIGGKENEIKVAVKNYRKIMFLGPKPHYDLPINQKASDILVVPNTKYDTQSALFTSPIKLFSHLLSERPIVVSRLPSTESIVGENEVYFYEADNAFKLAEKIKSIEINSVECTKKNQNAIALGKKFSWKIRAEKILNKLQS